MQYLRADTTSEVTIGPAVAVGDGFTPVISLTIAGADEAEIIKHGATATTAIAGTLAAITGADGYYALDLSATDTDTEGRLTLLINDDSLILPIRMEFMVVAANIFDSLFAVAGTDLLQIDQTQIVGTTVPTPTTAGVPDVNVERWLDTLVTLSGSLPDVNVEAMDANSIAVGVMATDSIGVLAMAVGSISAGTIAAGELTNIEDEIWDALKSAHVVASSFGDFLDIEVSSRLASADINLTGGAVDTVTAVTNAVTVGTINANVITATSINAAAFTSAKFATDAIDANALATDAVQKIRDAILPTQNVAFDNIEFLFVAASDGRTPVTGATGTAVTRSIDGGAFGSGTGTLTEVGNGIYQYDASAADMNGGIITFRFVGTGGTPGAPDDRFVTIVTGGGV